MASDCDYTEPRRQIPSLWRKDSTGPKHETSNQDELNGNLLTAAGAEFESALFEYLPTVVVGGQETEGVQVQYNYPGQDQVV